MIDILKKYYLLHGEELIYHDGIMAELIQLLWNSPDDELQFYNYFQLEKYLVDMGYISVYNDSHELIYPYMQHGIWYYRLHGEKIFE